MAKQGGTTAAATAATSAMMMNYMLHGEVRMNHCASSRRQAANLRCICMRHTSPWLPSQVNYIWTWLLYRRPPPRCLHRESFRCCRCRCRRWGGGWRQMDEEKKSVTVRGRERRRRRGASVAAAADEIPAVEERALMSMNKRMWKIQ